MKLETKIQKIGNKLVIILPKSIITNTEIEEGQVLKIQSDGKDIIIKTRAQRNKTNFPNRKRPIEKNDDIYSKTLKEEQLILAK